MERPLILLLLSTLGAAQAAAPVSFNVAAGSPASTYSAMFRNIGQVCTQSAHLKERGTGGSLDNIELLMNNEVSLASVQSVLVTRDFKTPDKRERLLACKKCAVSKLVSLHEEEGMNPKWQQVTFTGV